MEKLIFSLVVFARKLRPYYQTHRIITFVKAQTLAHFVVEFTPTAEEEKLVMKRKEKADDTSPTDSNLPNNMWLLHIDGASNYKGAGQV
ncbi:unnamed protein product [Prunus brigantina]